MYLESLAKALDRPRALCTEASGTPADVLVIEEAMRKVLESASHVNETIRVREQREELGALAWRFKGDVKVRFLFWVIVSLLPLCCLLAFCCWLRSVRALCEVFALRSQQLTKSDAAFVFLFF